MKILAIEDNPADVELLREFLLYREGSLFGLESAGTLAAAMTILSRGDIDFVLLDPGLPDSQGLDTLRAVRTWVPAIPIVVLTGFDDNETGMLAVREGAQDYLVKGQITGLLLVRSIRYAEERNRIEQELIRKNTDLDLMNEKLTTANEELNAVNEELTATEEELKRNVDELRVREEHLTKNEEELREALAEKEVLLSEIHHRVKNNLAAFISLLSLDGAYDESPAGLALKKDLQNRARSMALIHETLYRTRQYSTVDMDVYLSTLVSQVIDSYNSPQSFRSIVEAGGLRFDLTRATPCGLIINELVTNSLKYAFPDWSCRPGQKEVCTVAVRMTAEEGLYTLRVSDNGVGLPPGLDISTTQTLGLKLVNFLARHQLRATIETGPGPGAEFVFRFKEKRS